MLLDFLLAGLVIGGIYALISIGLNLQYGVARVLNLAYGEFLMLAGYGAFWGFTLLGLSPVLTLFVGAPLAFALSWLLFTYVLHPLLGRAQDQGKREIDSILSTFGLLFVLQGVALVAWSGTDRAYSYLNVPLNLFGAVIGANRLLVLVAALALSGGVYAFLRYSPVGRAMRAIAVSPRTAPLVGIDVARYSALAYAAGGALAAVAGILLSSFVGTNATDRRRLHHEGADRRGHGRHRPRAGRPGRGSHARACRNAGRAPARSRAHYRHQLRDLLDRAAVAAAGPVRRRLPAPARKARCASPSRRSRSRPCSR